jgi:hypothetical protein
VSLLLCACKSDVTTVVKRKESMFSKPGILLRIEGAFVLAMSVFFYRSGGARWSFFFLFFLWPDLSMVGYLASAQLGSRLYNSVHAYIFPLALACPHRIRSCARIRPQVPDVFQGYPPAASKLATSE